MEDALESFIITDGVDARTGFEQWKRWIALPEAHFQIVEGFVSFSLTRLTLRSESWREYVLR